MRIREYKIEDKQEIINMVSEILKNVFSGNPTQFEYVKEFNVTKDYVKYLVAETMDEEHKLIATMAIKRFNSEAVRLKRVYLRPEYRKRGIAQKMLNMLVEFAKEQGYKKLIFSTYPVMKNAHAFYKRNQFKEFEDSPKEQIHVVKEL